MRSLERTAAGFRLLACLCVPALGASPARAQAPAPPIPMITASASATVTVPPDRAFLQIGVLTRADTAEQAAQENAAKLDTALQAVRTVLEADADAEIQTHRYSLAPEYRYPKDGGRPEITGYTASNTVQVETSALDLVGPLVDAATAAGANELRALRFGLADDAAVRAEAASEAARRARVKVDAMARALGLRIVRVLAVEEAGARLPPPAPRVGRMMATEAAAPTPIEPGGIDVRSTVTVTVEVKGLRRG